MLKKGAFDLGRKSVYYLLVVVILFFLFVYVNKAVGESQVNDFYILDKLSYLSEINKLKSCFYYEHPLTGRIYNEIDWDKADKSKKNIFLECYNKPARVTISNKFDSNMAGFVAETTDHFFDYGGDFYSVDEFVLVRKDGKIFPAVLRLEVAVHDGDNMINFFNKKPDEEDL